MTRHISVTYDDILTGVPNDANSCPIAVAFLRIYGMEVEVFATNIEWYDPYSHETYKALLPDLAMDFIGRFDSDLPTQPIDFTVQFHPRERFPDD